jgi:hypothetical protein
MLFLEDANLMYPNPARTYRDSPLARDLCQLTRTNNQGSTMSAFGSLLAKMTVG